MKALVVGGSTNKVSSIITKLAVLLEAEDGVEFTLSCNKYNPADPVSIDGYDLVLWWPDIDNEEPKHYPVKDQGAVLICSKVMREETTRVDAVSRIFNMHGNAVVTISKNEDKFEFELIDALNNTWEKTTHLPTLSRMIMRLYEWTKASKRRSLTQNAWPAGLWGIIDKDEIGDFIQLNQELALKVAEGCGNRFFGNYSTRCTKLFPSTRRGKHYFFFSPRNVDKRFVSAKDLVLCDNEYYYGDRKPSVDTPVQLDLYKHFPNINWMIHGHAYIKGAKTTDFYCPCGDMREVKEIVDLVDKNGVTKLNLLNHGFLFMSKDLAGMRKHFEEYEFKMIGG